VQCGDKEGITLNYIMSQQERRSSSIELFGDIGSSTRTNFLVIVTIYRKR